MVHRACSARTYISMNRNGYAGCEFRSEQKCQPKQLSAYIDHVQDTKKLIDFFRYNLLFPRSTAYSSMSWPARVYLAVIIWNDEKRCTLPNRVQVRSTYGDSSGSSKTSQSPLLINSLQYESAYEIRGAYLWLPVKIAELSGLSSIMPNWLITKARHSYMYTARTSLWWWSGNE